MTTGEDQAQALVGNDPGPVDGGVGRQIGAAFELAPAHRVLLRRPHPVMAKAVDGAAARGGEQPGRRLLRHAPARPLFEGPRDGLAERLLGEVEVAERPRQRGQDQAGLLAEHALECRRTVHALANTGRTSTRPVRAEGIRRAQASAASRSAHSIR